MKIMDAKGEIICSLNFRDSFDGRTQYTDTQIGQRQNSLLLTALDKRRLPDKAT